LQVGDALLHSKASRADYQQADQAPHCVDATSIERRRTLEPTSAHAIGSPLQFGRRKVERIGNVSRVLWFADSVEFKTLALRRQPE
tara:strand:- start:3152 stop:3409 length:258 start_codon:yes stop_codon:yes gene_type:complete